MFHDEALAEKYFGRMGAGGWLFGGHSGVEYFFVLSGLIIFGVHRRDIARPEQIKPYVLKRLIRIFPIFWLVVIPLGLAFLANHNLGADRDLTGTEFLRDIFLLPREGKLTLPPAWTLQHELVFYGIFASLILSRRIGIALFAIWQIACVATFAFNLIPASYQNIQPAARLLGHENLGFLFGLVIVVLDRRIGFSGRRSAKIVGLVGGVFLLGILVAEGARAFVLMPDAAVEAVTYFVIYACVIIGLLAVPNIPRPWLDKSLGRLGHASYALYLTHEPISSATMALLNRSFIRPAMNAQAAYWICIGVAVVASLVVHYRVEKPMLGFLRRTLTPGRAEPVPLAIGGTR